MIEMTSHTNDKSPLSGVRGRILSFKSNPFVDAPEDCYDYFPNGLVVMRDGRIVDVGEYADVAPRHESLSADAIDRYEDALIMPGFIDCHTHYVQSPMIGSFGDTLLDWLNQYTFPNEIRFADKDFADNAARMFFRQILSQGTTTANVFATTYASSVDAFLKRANATAHA